MKRLSLVLVAAILDASGCTDRMTNPVDKTTGLPIESIEGFAKAEGISIEEATKCFENGQTFTKNPHQIATDPPVNSRAMKAGTARSSLPAEPLGEATASDAGSGHAIPTRSGFGPGTIQTTGGFGPKRY